MDAELNVVGTVQPTAEAGVLELGMTGDWSTRKFVALRRAEGGRSPVGEGTGGVAGAKTGKARVPRNAVRARPSSNPL